MNFVSLTKSFKDNQGGYFPWRERGLVCLAVLAAYASVWPNVFVFDDAHIIVLNAFLKNWSRLPKLLTSLNFAGSGVPGGFYRPVPMLAYFLIYRAFGASTIAFHALNIALQALNACLLHHFGVKAGFGKGVAFAAALLWAVHPLHTEAVAYMSAASELLWSTFCLAGLITLLPDFSTRRIWQTMIFFMLALLSKETAVIFPALAAVTFFLVSKDRARLSAYLKMWPLWLLTTGYIGIWLLFIHQYGYTTDETGSPEFFRDYVSNLTNRVLTSLATLPVYARLIIWPEGLHMERRFEIFDTLLAVAAGSGCFDGRRLPCCKFFRGRSQRGLALSFGLLWFAVALSPYTGILIPVNAQVSEGWMYMPTDGAFFWESRRQQRRSFEKRLNACAAACGAWHWRSHWAPRHSFKTRYGARLKRFIRTSCRTSEDTFARQRAFWAVFYMGQGEFDKAIKHLQYEIDHPDGRPKIQCWQAGGVHLKLAMAWLQGARG